MKNKQQTEITTLSEILHYLKEEDLEDRDDYASRLASLYVDSVINGEDESRFRKNAYKIKSNFFKVNRIKKLDLLQKVYRRLKKADIRPPILASLPPLSIAHIFPEVGNISDSQLDDIDKKLNIDEAIIQNALRSAFRDRAAFPIARRGKDSALEVADIEHFHVKIDDETRSFTIVVKGLSSLHGKKKKVNWEDISHQVTKAYNTRPDYIIVATAAEPVDRLITEMHLYAESVGKPNLIVFVPPMDLARFLTWRKVI